MVTMAPAVRAAVRLKGGKAWKALGRAPACGTCKPQRPLRRALASGEATPSGSHFAAA
jgi:hypothetical protein